MKVSFVFLEGSEIYGDKSGVRFVWKNAVDTEFVLPTHDNYYATNCGQEIAEYRFGIKPRKMNLCREHMEHLATWVSTFDEY